LLFPLFVALKLLCDPDNIPAMVNCRAGKDRTGIVIALALWCTGWSKDDIVADYAQSQVCSFSLGLVMHCVSLLAHFLYGVVVHTTDVAW